MYNWNTDEFNNEIKRQRRLEKRIDKLDTNRKFNYHSQGSNPVGYSSMSAISDCIAEVYGKEYSKNFLRNF